LGTIRDADIDKVFQEVAIPADVTDITVDFWYRLETDETVAGADVLCFAMWYLDHSVAWGNCFADFGAMGATDWTQFVYSLSPAELAAVAGQTVTFGFQSQNDFSLVSQGWVDDTALNLTTSGSTPTKTPTPTRTPTVPASTPTHTPTPTRTPTVPASTPTKTPTGPPPVNAGPLRIILAWTDYPGSLSAAKALVNNLDLEVIAPDGTHYYGNAGLYGAGNSCLRDGKWDKCNNVEGVLIPVSKVGEYTVIVHGVNIPQGPQPFALAAFGDNLLPGEGSSAGNVYLPAILRGP
jgi:hypothetical protein